MKPRQTARTRRWCLPATERGTVSPRGPGRVNRHFLRAAGTPATACGVGQPSFCTTRPLTQSGRSDSLLEHRLHCSVEQLTTNYLIWLLVKPSHLLFFAGCLGVLRWHTRFGRWCRGLAVAGVIAFGIVPISWLLLKPLESRFAVPQSLDRVDGVVVLGGGELVELSDLYAQPQLNDRGDRLTTFLLLAGRYPEARLIHSGRRESKAAKELILGLGVSSDRVFFDGESSDTCESASVLSRRIAPKPDDTWLLVTSAFHMPRAMACFRASGWDLVAYPADFRTGQTPFHFDLADNLESLDLAAHEWLGLMYYRVRGRTHEWFPAAGE